MKLPRLTEVFLIREGDQRDWLITIPADIALYHGGAQREDWKWDQPTWFTEDLSHAQSHSEGYEGELIQFRVVRPIPRVFELRRDRYEEGLAELKRMFNIDFTGYGGVDPQGDHVGACRAMDVAHPFE